MGWLQAAAGIFGGLKGGQAAGDYMAQKQTAEQARSNMYAGSEALNSDMILKRLANLQEAYSGFFNQLQAGEGLQAQYAARGIQSNLARAGLGNTGLGSALGAGVTAGVGFGNNMLRARMQQDLLNQAIALQSQRASMLAGAPVMQQPSLASNVAQRGGEALSAIGLWQSQFGGQGGGATLPTNSNRAGIPDYPYRVPGPIQNPSQSPLFFMGMGG